MRRPLSPGPLRRLLAGFRPEPDLATPTALPELRSPRSGRPARRGPRRRRPRPGAALRIPFLARLRVGRKLMLLVLLPVTGMLAFTVFGTVSNISGVGAGMRSATAESVRSSRPYTSIAVSPAVMPLVIVKRGARGATSELAAERSVLERGEEGVELDKGRTIRASQMVDGSSGLYKQSWRCAGCTGTVNDRTSSKFKPALTACLFRFRNCR